MFTNILLCQCLAMTIWTRTCLTMRSPPRRTLLHVRFPPNHHALHHPLAVQDQGQRTRVTPRLRLNPAEEPLVDPSSDCIDVALLLLTWYRLFRRCDPPKDEADINELQELAHWYLNLSKNI